MTRQLASTEHSAAFDLSPLEFTVLESVAYSDVFDYPLTAAEIRRGLSIVASEAEVAGALAGEGLGRYLQHRSPYYTLAGRDEIVRFRQERERSSEQLWRRARYYGGQLARLPFVRMVAVTGALSMDNAADGDDDIDYLIVTEPGRLWLARAMTVVLVRLAGLRGVTLCPNYFLAETALTLPDRDLYTAHELLQMAPLAGGETYARMLAENGWWQDYLPNATPRSATAGSEHRGWAQQALESLLRGRVGDTLEARLLGRKGRELGRQAPENPEAVFSATVCKGHFESYRQRTQEAVAERLRRRQVGVA